MSEQDPEEMRYGMLGEDSSSEAEKLEKYSGEVGWEYLRPHFESNSLFWVDPSLSIGVVGEALANDDADSVGAWLKSADLVKVSDLHAAQWEGGEDLFAALVISPFVLMQATPPKDQEDQDASLPE